MRNLKNFGRSFLFVLIFRNEDGYPKCLPRKEEVSLLQLTHWLLYGGCPRCILGALQWYFAYVTDNSQRSTRVKVRNSWNLRALE